MLLTSTSDIIRIVTSSTADIHVQAGWADITTTTFTPGRTNTAITTATTTTIVGSPAASTQRQVKTLSIFNTHASTSNTITIQHYDGTTSVDVYEVTLAAGERAQYNGDEWPSMATGAGVTDGDKGDITVSGSGAAWTIDNGVVSLAKQADVATSTVFYRKTAGTGSPEVQTLATLKTDLGLTGTNSGDQTITLTGDVTGSGTGSFAATIANDAVTYAKMQNVSATDKLLGRSTAGSGDVEEIACTAAGRALLDDADASAQRTTLGLGTLATQSGTFSGTSSGTNTGDQNLFQTISVSGQSDVVADSTTDTLTLAAGANITITTNATTDTITIAASGGAVPIIRPAGRLTLVTAVPVMTTDQSAKTTIYYTPYVGNTVPIYDGSTFTNTTFTELSVATTDTTKNPAAIGASKVNDWFVWNDSGTMRVSHGPDWTNDTTRSAGTALTLVNGVYLNNASITNGPAASRGTYVGTTRSNSSSQLDWIFGSNAADGGTASHYVWNMYNRVTIGGLVGDSRDSHNYTTASWRAWNNVNLLRLNTVCGLSEDAVNLMFHVIMQSSGSGVGLAAGIGIDSTSAFSGTPSYIYTYTAGAGTSFACPPALYKGYPGIGAHYAQGLEYGGVGATQYGDGGAPTLNQIGLHYILRM